MIGLTEVFVFQPKIFDFIEGKKSILESDSLKKLASINQLNGFKHEDIWHCMDTIRDKEIIEKDILPKYLRWIKK